ncbi:MAG: hypothetical protein GSR80_000107 [Desulfurococcales archaeon]|nr:hypothetical protein [Desulfurococcales archaeon]
MESVARLREIAERERVEADELRRRLRGLYGYVDGLAWYLGERLNAVYGPKYMLRLGGAHGIHWIYGDGYGKYVSVALDGCNVRIFADGFVTDSGAGLDCLRRASRALEALLTPEVKRVLDELGELVLISCYSESCEAQRRAAIEERVKTLRRLVGVA